MLCTVNEPCTADSTELYSLEFWMDFFFSLDFASQFDAGAGLCEPVLQQQGGGHPQGHVQADRHRRAPHVPPGGPLPAEGRPRDGGEDPVHLGHQENSWRIIFPQDVSASQTTK